MLAECKRNSLIYIMTAVSLPRKVFDGVDGAKGEDDVDGCLSTAATCVVFLDE